MFDVDADALLDGASVIGYLVLLTISCEKVLEVLVAGVHGANIVYRESIRDVVGLVTKTRLGVLAHW